MRYIKIHIIIIIGFASVYPLDSNLSGGQRYPSFEQLGLGLFGRPNLK